jgi:hypothetical protein
MSVFSFNITDSKILLPVLERIATALERIAPLPDEKAPELTPEEAVSYADDAALARQEEIAEMGATAQQLEQFLKDHPEWDTEELRAVEIHPANLGEVWPSTAHE